MDMHSFFLVCVHLLICVSVVGVHAFMFLSACACISNSEREGEHLLSGKVVSGVFLAYMKTQALQSICDVSDLKEMTHHVLNSMMGYIAPPALLQKIIQVGKDVVNE